MSARSLLVKQLPCIACQHEGVEKPEQWRPVVGWETAYEVSDLGRVRSIARRGVHGREKDHYFPSRILQSFRTSGGYSAVNITDNADPTRPRRRAQLVVHRAVLSAFVGPCPAGMEGCHNNGNRTDARLANLRWDTRKANHADKEVHGTSQKGRKRPLPLTAEQVRRIRNSGLSDRALARELGRSPITIMRCRRGVYFRGVS